jgi:hypothetical protein
MTPSRTLCSIASRSWSRDAISCSSRPKVDHQRDQRAEPECEPGVQRQEGDLLRELGVDLLLEDARGDLADDLAVRGADGRLPVRRPAEAAGVDAHVGVAVQRDDGFLDLLADERDVRVGQPGAVTADDHHVAQRVHAVPHLLGERLDGALRIGARRERLHDLRQVGDRLGHRQCALLVLAVERIPGVLPVQDEPHRHGDDQDRQLTDQYPGGQFRVAAHLALRSCVAPSRSSVRHPSPDGEGHDVSKRLTTRRNAH